jgi:uncharacterized protein YceK
MKYFVMVFVIAGCSTILSRQISTEEALWLEDPKTSELLYCKTKTTLSDQPVCYQPRRITE